MPMVIKDREMRLEMKTYSSRCTKCNAHKPLYGHPDDSKLYCKNCMFIVNPWKDQADIKEKFMKVIEHMIDQYQQGQINRDDYENSEHLLEGYKQALEDALEELVAQFPSMQLFAKKMRDELVVLNK